VDEVFYPDLKGKFKEKGFHNVRVELVEEVESDKDRTIKNFLSKCNCFTRLFGTEDTAGNR